MDKVSYYFEQARKAHNRWIAMMLCLSMLVTIGTFAAFHKDAIAKTYAKRVLCCPYAEEGAERVAHKHNTDCYCENVLVCTLTECEGHIHTDACFCESAVLCCELEETPGHVHKEGCFEEYRTLICGEEASEGHKHTEECYALERGELLCSIVENNHEHTDECFALNQVLVCDQEEGEGAHRHREDCYCSKMQLSCGIAEGEGAHTHSEDCYTIAQVLVCAENELITHQHGPECFRIIEINDDEKERKEEDAESAATNTEETKKRKVERNTDLEEAKEENDEETALPERPQSDPTADLEAAEVWERSFENLELSGMWSRDLVMIAESQLGYSESSRNFDALLNEAKDGYSLRGWTRYGEWYGYPYGDWCAMFVSFCLHYAGISKDDFPYDCGTITWVNSLKDLGMYARAENYEPKPGDLIFFDWEGDGLTDHVGIVYEADGANNYLCTIEGNRTANVETFEYVLDDWRIMGYGVLPENSENDADSEETDTGSRSTEISEEEKSDEKTEPEESSETEEETDRIEVDMPAQSWVLTVGGIRVSAEAPEHAFPADTKMSAAPVNGNMLKTAVADVVSGEVLEVQAVDITFVTSEGAVVEPALPIRVTMTPWASPHEEQTAKIVHIDKSGDAELVELEEDTEAASDRDVTFNADAFSIYAVVYVVEFEYESDREVYRFNLPGDGSITLSELAEELGLVGIANGENTAKFESREDFINQVENVLFSDDSLISVMKIEPESVEEILEAENSSPDTSTELPDETDEIIEEEARTATITVSDWILIPLEPFSTEETLTITMRNGDEIRIRVTDDQKPDAGELPVGESITIILETSWTDGTDTTPPEGATAVFTVHQQRADVSINHSEEDLPAADCTETENRTADEQTGEEQTPGDSASLTEEEPESDDGTIDEIPTLEYIDTDIVYTVSLPAEDGSWSAEIGDLITVDEQGNRYRYYITEDSSFPSAASVIFKDENDVEISEPGDGETPKSAPIETNRTVTIENTYSFGSVKVTNHFIGIEECQIPEDYRIIASWAEGEVEKSLELTMEEDLPEGVTREEDGLTNTWTIEQIPVNTEVTFSEVGYEVQDHAVTVNGNATPEPIMKLAAAEPDAAVFSNEYDQERLTIQKVWNGGATPKEVEVELRRTINKVCPIHVEIRDSNGIILKTINSAVEEGGDISIKWNDNGTTVNSILLNNTTVKNNSMLSKTGAASSIIFYRSGKLNTISLKTINVIENGISIIINDRSDVTGGSIDLSGNINNALLGNVILNENKWSVSWPLEGSKNTARENGTGTLAKYDDKKREYHYYVLEKTKIDGVTTTYNPPAGASSGLLQVINTGNEVVVDPGLSIRVQVQNDHETALSNAVFELLKQGSSGNFEKVTHTTLQCLDQNDRFMVPIDGFTLSGLTDGVYQLEQIKEADGGVITERVPVKFTVHEGTLLVNAEDLKSATYQARDNNIQDSLDIFTIINPIGAVLPATGGMGISSYTLTGVILFFAAGVLLILNRKKQMPGLNT